MTEYRYPVASTFPAGLNLCFLIEELYAAWPADLGQTSFTIHGKKPPGGYRAGVLILETPRDLVAVEETSAASVFASHAGGDEHMVGASLASLPPVKAAAGSVQFVRDVERLPNAGGQGTMVYSDGAVWRRVSNDEEL